MDEENLISVVISFRNEEENIPELIKRIKESIEKTGYKYEIIFVNDASTDNSLEILKEYAEKDKRIKIINLSRRFGYNQGIMAGFCYTKGDAVITLDADLQDPPELIPELIKKWKDGVDIVHTVRKKREGESKIKNILTKLAYNIINFVSELKLLQNAGNFKLISRKTLNEILKLKEKDPYVRGLVAWTGFKQDYIYYVREKRYKGKTHFPFLRSMGPFMEFISGVTSFSILPLLYIVLLGIILTFLGIVFLLLSIFNFLQLWIGLIIFLSGIIVFSIGIVGVYIGRIWKEVLDRPNYIVESTINIEEN
ncbi:MAG: glycosyltransferase [bacterium]|nr:glycosyltransferase [bacterium]MDW8163690.1 glycosyltransferase [Candidatus Omnitrophota bacterium]